MTLFEYLSINPRGTAKKMAQQIGACQTDVSNWAREVRPVPSHFCVPIETFTNGAVTRKDLKPNKWRRIWPELSEGE